MFFFKQKTAYEMRISDWSSDVCSSDLRLRRRLSQEHLARRVGLSVRWLREIESGNPAVALDDHLRCAAALRLAPAFVLLPLLEIGRASCRERVCQYV